MKVAVNAIVYLVFALVVYFTGHFTVDALLKSVELTINSYQAGVNMVPPVGWIQAFESWSHNKEN